MKQFSGLTIQAAISKRTAHGVRFVKVKTAAFPPAIILPQPCWQAYVYAVTTSFYGLGCNPVNGAGCFVHFFFFFCICVSSLFCVSLWSNGSMWDLWTQLCGLVKRIHFSIWGVNFFLSVTWLETSRLLVTSLGRCVKYTHRNLRGWLRFQSDIQCE